MITLPEYQSSKALLLENMAACLPVDVDDPGAERERRRVRGVLTPDGAVPGRSGRRVPSKVYVDDMHKEP